MGDQPTFPLSTDTLLAELTRIAFGSIGDAFDPRGHLRPLEELPRMETTIASIRVARRGSHTAYTVRMADKIRALRILYEFHSLQGDYEKMTRVAGQRRERAAARRRVIPKWRDSARRP